MTTSQMRRCEMLRRVRDFGDTHREWFPVSSPGGQAFEAVGAAVQQLSAHAVSKMTATAQGREAKAQARQALHSRLQTIGRCARVIAGDDGNPEFSSGFPLPPPLRDGQLLTTGQTYVRNVEAVKARFIVYGLPDGFVESLTAVVFEFEQAIRGREAARDSRTAARASIEAALASGMAAVRKLEFVIAHQLQDDPVSLAVWGRDRRVDYSHRGRKNTPPAEVTPAVQPGASPPAATDAAGASEEVAS